MTHALQLNLSIYKFSKAQHAEIQIPINYTYSCICTACGKKFQQSVADLYEEIITCVI